MRANANTPLYVHSWDFDGMLASKAYTDKLEELLRKAKSENRSLNNKDYDDLAKHIINTYKKEFFDDRFGGQYSNSDHVVFVGSDRQDRKTDIDNGSLKSLTTSKMVTGTMSCYPFYVALVDALKDEYGVKIELNKFLLEDLYHDDPKITPGSIFNDETKANLNLSAKLIADSASLYDGKANEYTIMKDLIAELNSKRTLPPPIQPKYVEKSKFMALFTQLHLSRQNHATSDQQPIICRFADDRRDVLAAAEEVFSPKKGFPSLLPPNTTLMIEQFLPPDAEYRHSSKEEQDNPQTKNRWGKYKSKQIKATSDAETDKNVLTNISQMHKDIVKTKNLSPNEEFIINKINELRTEQRIIAQSSAVRHIINALNSLDSKSIDIKDMTKIIEDGNLNPQEKLERLQKKGKAAFGILKSVKDPETKRLFEALRDMEITNPDVNILKNLTQDKKSNVMTSDLASSSPSIAESSSASNASTGRTIRRMAGGPLNVPLTKPIEVSTDKPAVTAPPRPKTQTPELPQEATRNRRNATEKAPVNLGLSVFNKANSSPANEEPDNKLRRSSGEENSGPGTPTLGGGDNNNK